MSRRLRTFGAFFALAGLLAGCGVAEPGGYAAGPRELVLQMVHIPGVIRPGEPTSIVPVFSMYGDGRVLVNTTDNYNGALPALTQMRLSRARTQQLVDAALDAGVQDDSEHNIDIAPDAPTSLLTLNAEDTSGWVEMGPEGRGRLADLRRTLQEYTESDRTTGYRHDAIAVLSTPGTTGVDAPVQDWPLDELRQNAELRIDGTLCKVYRRVGVEDVTATAIAATPDTTWISGDQSFIVQFRPMLPHESDCESLIHRGKAERGLLDDD